MTEQQKPDLSQIEPIGKVLDTDDHPAGGTNVEVAQRDVVDREAEPRTSPETEEQLDQLRRG
jgi:hypothetical protein